MLPGIRRGRPAAEAVSAPGRFSRLDPVLMREGLFKCFR